MRLLLLALGLTSTASLAQPSATVVSNGQLPACFESVQMRELYPRMKIKNACGFAGRGALVLEGGAIGLDQRQQLMQDNRLCFLWRPSSRLNIRISRSAVLGQQVQAFRHAGGAKGLPRRQWSQCPSLQVVEPGPSSDGRPVASFECLQPPLMA